ncbi:MAG TPA: helix-turn-helix transcriptional regulator [Gaiellaceae bacterium]|jgi:transcriptional regulator with XRE-family HTH domain|nr:helix-turn-helix transcriptional regulator [Gaiellaceae bacterium]
MSNELGEFLRSRRAQIQPEDVGFRAGRGRRVEGLRREEVAALASVSVDYIKRLEAGRITPSEPVLDSLARALQLDAVERKHLYALAGRASVYDVDPFEDVRPGLLRLLAAVEPLPAFIVGPWLDLLAWNPTASALFCGFERRPPAERNMARLIFLDPEIRDLFFAGGWDGSGLVASLRVRYTQGQPDQRVQALISELIERSPVFRQLWEEHGAVKRMKGRKTFNHPEIGEIELDWDRLTVPGASGQVLMVYSAAPGTPGATALTLLSTLAATAAQPG